MGQAEHGDAERQPEEDPYELGNRFGEESVRTIEPQLMQELVHWTQYMENAMAQDKRSIRAAAATRE